MGVAVGVEGGVGVRVGLRVGRTTTDDARVTVGKGDSTAGALNEQPPTAIAPIIRPNRFRPLAPWRDMRML